MNCILTSYLDLYDKNELGEKIPKKIGNQNQILDNIKKYVKKYDNFLFVASDEFNHEVTDMYAQITFSSFNLTIPFKHYDILDTRTEDQIDDLLNNADLIFLCGGHVPTQNRFFQKINLRKKIQKANALIIGVSAGAMNMADNVYCVPELEGESLDSNFSRHLKGLSLTNINVLPHYEEIKEEYLDGKKVVEDIVLPDTFETEVYGINNGSYILITDKKYLYGEAYLLKNGTITQINIDNQVLEIKELKFNNENI